MPAISAFLIESQSLSHLEVELQMDSPNVGSIEVCKKICRTSVSQ